MIESFFSFQNVYLMKGEEHFLKENKFYFSFGGGGVKLFKLCTLQQSKGLYDAP